MTSEEQPVKKLSKAGRNWYTTTRNRLSDDVIGLGRFRTKTLVQLSSGGLAFSLLLATFLAQIVGDLPKLSFIPLAFAWIAFGLALRHTFASVNKSIRALRDSIAMFDNALRKEESAQVVDKKYRSFFEQMGAPVRKRSETAMIFFYAGAFCLIIFVSTALYPLWRK